MSGIGIAALRWLRHLVPAVAGVLFTAGNTAAYMLPDSGQATCYQIAFPYAVIPCEGTGQDGQYDINPMQFTDNGDGTVTDGNTGLIWQRQDDGATYNWYRASGTQNAVQNPEGTDVCGSLILGDADDWRLPTVDELLSLVDFGVAPPGPAIRIEYFPATQAGYYWSSTVRNRPYGIDFSGGWANNVVNGPYDELRVRCVRGTSEPQPMFADNGNGTVTDQRTDLTWQRGQSASSLGWTEALAYCEGLDLGGATSWRLPNIKELWTLVDLTPSPPNIDHDLFPGVTVAMDHWTSTTNPTNNAAWGVYFYSAMIENLVKPQSFRARCVTGRRFGPLAASDDAATIEEDTSERLGVTWNDTGTGALTLTAVSAPENGQATHDGRLVTYTPPPNWYGVDRFTYTVTDETGVSATASVVVTVSSANDSPTLDSLGDLTIEEDAPPLEVTLAGITAGPGESQDLVVTASSSNPALLPNPAVDYASPSPTGSIFLAPAANAHGTATVTVTIDDGEIADNTVSRSFIVHVEAVNDAPVLNPLSPPAAGEGTVLEFSVTAVDPDVGDSLTYTITGPKPGGGAGDVDPVSGLFRWPTLVGDEGRYPVTFTVTDTTGASDSASTELVITDVNKPPYFDPQPLDQAVVAGGVVRLVIAGSDADIGDVVSVSLVAGPPEASFDETTGLFSWTPGIDDVGVHRATFRVTDDGTPAEWTEATIAITVNDPAIPVFEDTFADGTRAGDPDWTVAQGAWSVASGRYCSSRKSQGLTWISMFDPVARPLAAGVVQARVKLTTRYRRFANGSLAFGYLDTGHYRYVEVRQGRVFIGQKGEIDGMPTSRMKSRRVRIPIGKFRTFRVKFDLTGEVVVYQGTRLLASHQFPAAVPGGIGLGANQAQTLFDDVKVWESLPPGR